jgi:D-apionolactonase
MSDDPLARGSGGDAITLRAGPLDAVFQDGALHTFMAFGVEVWRGVMFLHRDASWRTPPTVVRNVAVTTDNGSFRLTFDARCCTDPAIVWHAIVEGHPHGSIRFAVEARPEGDVLTSRTGLCVLHPLAAAAVRLEIEHDDGRLSQSTFPALISPWPPFTNIRALRHEFIQGCWARCRFAGDVFEMEDQRSFSDASFKTYSRSNLAPRPYRLAAGECVRQSVVLTLDACTPPIAPTRASDASVEVATPRVGRLPRIGLTLSAAHVASGARPGLWHASIDRTVPASTLEVDWRTIETAAATASVAFDLLLADDGEAAKECAALAEHLASSGVTPGSIAVFPTTARALSAARTAFPHTPVGGGTPWFFTHLNRASLPPGLDFITFRTCPIVHVADDRSVMQTLSTLPSIIATLRARHPDVPFRAGPSSIAMSVNPFGPWPEARSGTRVAMARSDARDEAPFGVAWAIGYLARFASGGADAVSFSSAAVVRALASLASLAGAGLRQTTVSDDRIAALALDTPRGIEAWIANLTREYASVSVRLPDGDRRTEAIAAHGVAHIEVPTAGRRVDR